LLGNKQLHEHKHDGYRAMVFGRLAKNNRERSDNHHLPQHHKPRAQSLGAVQIMVHASVEPTPEYESEQSAKLDECMPAQMVREPMREPRNRDDVNQVVKKLEPADVAVSLVGREILGRTPPDRNFFTQGHR